MKFSTIMKILCLAVLVPLLGCAVFGDVVHAPRVSVESIRTEWTTPEYWKLMVKLQIRNNNPLTLGMSQGTCTISTAEGTLVSATHASLPVVPGYSTNTVELPVNLPLKQVHDKYPSNKKIRLLVRGTLQANSSWQKSLLEFAGSRNVDVPFIPEMAFKYVRLVKKKPVVFLQTENRNRRPINLKKADVTLQADGQTIPLMLTKPQILKPGRKTLVMLVMASSVTKKQVYDGQAYLNGEMEAVSENGMMRIPVTQSIQTRGEERK